MIEKFVKQTETIEKQFPLPISKKAHELIKRKTDAKTMKKYLEYDLKLIKEQKISMNYFELITYVNGLIKKCSDFNKIIKSSKGGIKMNLTQKMLKQILKNQIDIMRWISKGNPMEGYFSKRIEETEDILV